MRVLGRTDETAAAGPTGHLGRYLAQDGSTAGRIALDLNRPHVILVVGKRGYGKSHTLGVVAEAASSASGVAPVVADPMGTFGGLSECGVSVNRSGVPAGALSPRAWCELLGLSTETAAGSLLWQAADRADTLAEMRTVVAKAEATRSATRTVQNHLSTVEDWDVFDCHDDEPVTSEGRVTDLEGLGSRAMNAVVAGVATRLYDSAAQSAIPVLPWLLLDEAHAFDGIAAPSIERLATRGRQPGVSLVVATQRPDALSPVVCSQADLLVVHRLTDRRDLAALESIQPSYLTGSVLDRIPTGPGEAVVVDDATESVHTLRIRDRHTPHHGASPRASG